MRIGARFYVPVAEVERFRGGGTRVSHGEGVWEFDGDGPELSLPRASVPVAADEVLGG